MLDKIAVIIRGHRRTWDYCKPFTFSFFSMISKRVDYYVVLWNTNKDNPVESLLNDFQHRNLKVLKNISIDTEYYNPWRGPAYLSQIAGNYIFEEECLSNKKYDLIFDTRPDVAFQRINGTQFFTIDNAVGCDRVQPEPTNDGGHIWQGLSDQCFTMNSKTHAIWSQRHRLGPKIQEKLSLITGNHSMLWIYSKIYNIDSYTFPWFRTEIVRPNIQYLSSESLDQFFIDALISRNKWNTYNTEKRISETLAAGIDLEDYQDAFSTYTPL